MFLELNPAYIIALIFFLTSGSYIVLSVVTYTGNIDTRPQRDYLAAGSYLVLFSLFYGLMTIAGNETSLRIFWALGFISGFIFFPGWILFLANKPYPQSRSVRYTLVTLFVLTLLIAVICVMSNETVMVATRFGNQFSYHGSMIFRIAFIYLTLITVLLVYFQFKWLQKAEITRYRKEALGFIIFSVVATPIGFITDFVIPTFTEYTIVPLGSISILAACIPTYVSMRVNKTLSIEIRNVSGHVFRSITLPILLLDHNNTVKLENEAAVDFFERSVCGENIANIIHIDGMVPKQSFFSNSFSSETITAKTQSSARICEMLLTVERDKFDDALCKVVVITDLTELLLTLEQANNANKAKSDFMSNMGVKIRTPMNAIFNGLEALMSDNQDNKEIKDGLESVHGSCDLLLSIINDIMDFSKLEADKLDLLPTKYNTMDVINDSVRLNAMRIEDKQIEFELQIDEAIPKRLKGDELRVKQILDKLLSNAFKYTDKGKITLSVFTEPGPSGAGVTLVLSVRDTGVGMSKEQLDSLFDEYSRLSIHANPALESTGLGLTITQSLVNLMNGEIRVESEPGQGTFVIVRLPQGIVKPEAPEE